ncbi:MAG: molybdenum cofactor guanylyltransferase [Methanobrevibacter sp.]|jgi:molybdopterin-guanine dinucleotide biosynthesis protein A|nr:molybdenum cofactor guanylyltransferase [Candidatus Methanovirga aequatorialis]
MNVENHFTCILLCGGMSKRMGQDKGSMLFHDKPMIISILETLDHEIDELIIALNSRERVDKYRSIVDRYFHREFSYKIIFVEDEFKNKGPLSGIMTGLKNTSSEYSLVIPCDSPYITKRYIKSIFKIKDKIKNDFDSLIPYHNNKTILNDGVDKPLNIKDKNFNLNFIEPLHGIYNRRLIDKIEKNIGDNKLDIKSIIRGTDTYLIDTKNFDKINFRNINCHNDLK